MKKLLYALGLLLPWPLQRLWLKFWFGYQIDPTAHIGFAWVMPRRLVMGPRSRIGHLTIVKGLELLQLGADSLIGRGNWITAYPLDQHDFFSHQKDRRPELILGDHAAITNRHMIDCTSQITVGSFTTVAGFSSQLLTHSIDLEASRQDSKPIRIGEYCFVGTKSVLLGGCTLPSYSVLGAKSLLNKVQHETHRLYAGIPARPIKSLPPDLGYFSRREGVVH